MTKRIKQTGEYLAASITKECKCEKNTIVNHGCINRSLKQKELLKDIYNYFDVENEGVTKECHVLCERIRELLPKEDKERK